MRRDIAYHGNKELKRGKEKKREKKKTVEREGGGLLQGKE